MRKNMRLTWGGYGALNGLLFTAALMGILYLADQIAGLPFVPYDLFDWIARVLPGDVITKGIDTMVEVIDKLNLGATDTTAKRLETIMALMTFLGGGMVTGAILYMVLDRANVRGAARYRLGLLTGVVMGLPMILISRDVNVTATASEGASLIWLIIAVLVWGASLGWAYDRLRGEVVEPLAAEAPVTAEPINRRQFLIKVGGAAATLTIAGTGFGRYLERRDEKEYEDRIEHNMAAAQPDDLPNADAAVEPAPGTRPEYTPLDDHYRIDINLRPPEIDGDVWELNVHGLVDSPRTLNLDDIYQYETMDQYVTLACISNRIAGDLTSTTRWTGIRMLDFLADFDLQDSATHLKISSEDGFYETVSLELIASDPRVMLTTMWDGIPLLHKHGFPLRIYIPDRYGMKQPKWITDIEVIDHDEDGYWVERSWDKVAQMRAVSVVDVVAAEEAYTDDQGRTLVPVGGIAHAGARGISKVEVQVDGGEWVEAQLREPLSETTWVIWRYDWPFEAGEHTFAVRCYEGDGTMQIEEENPTQPSGATGIHALTREL